MNKFLREIFGRKSTTKNKEQQEKILSDFVNLLNAHGSESLEVKCFRTNFKNDSELINLFNTATRLHGKFQITDKFSEEKVFRVICNLSFRIPIIAKTLEEAMEKAGDLEDFSRGEYLHESFKVDLEATTREQEILTQCFRQ